MALRGRTRSQLPAGRETGSRRSRRGPSWGSRNPASGTAALARLELGVIPCDVAIEVAARPVEMVRRQPFGWIKPVNRRTDREIGSNFLQDVLDVGIAEWYDVQEVPDVVGRSPNVVEVVPTLGSFAYLNLLPTVTHDRVAGDLVLDRTTLVDLQLHQVVPQRGRVIGTPK